jgi:putative tryptophan/tyrosine transport system substrate-binding protein
MKKPALSSILVATLLLVLEVAAEAQQPTKIPRIGFLFIGSKDQPHLGSFRQGLRDLGYIEGKNIVIEYRYAEGNRNALPTLAAELVTLNLNVILTTTPQASRAVVQATSTVPIVITGFDPVRIGLAKSLAQPGGNLTGLSSEAGSSMPGKRLELLKEAFPNIKIVGLLTSPTSETRESTLDLTKTVAKALGLQIHPIDVKDGADIDRSFEPLKKLRVDALHLPAGQITTLNSKRLIALAAKLGVPAIYHTSILVEEGGLMAYGVNFPDLYRRAAIYVDKILKGRKPADLPIEQPMKFELVINLKAAKQIGVEISPNVLARADKVIK